MTARLASRLVLAAGTQRLELRGRRAQRHDVGPAGRVGVLDLRAAGSSTAGSPGARHSPSPSTPRDPRAQGPECELRGPRQRRAKVRRRIRAAVMFAAAGMVVNVGVMLIVLWCATPNRVSWCRRADSPLRPAAGRGRSRIRAAIVSQAAGPGIALVRSARPWLLRKGRVGRPAEVGVIQEPVQRGEPLPGGLRRRKLGEPRRHPSDLLGELLRRVAPAAPPRRPPRASPPAR
jgi:hypothetical protein